MKLIKQIESVKDLSLLKFVATVIDRMFCSLKIEANINILFCDVDFCAGVLLKNEICPTKTLNMITVSINIIKFLVLKLFSFVW